MNLFTPSTASLALPALQAHLGPTDIHFHSPPSPDIRPCCLKQCGLRPIAQRHRNSGATQAAWKRPAPIPSNHKPSTSFHHISSPAHRYCAHTAMATKSTKQYGSIFDKLTDSSLYTGRLRVSRLQGKHALHRLRPTLATGVTNTALPGGCVLASRCSQAPI